jgi:hypothetical protein
LSQNFITYRIVDFEALGPVDDNAGFDRGLANREGEGEPGFPDFAGM